MSKPEFVKINLSETFMVRSRCKDCGELPSSYYYSKNPFLWKDPSSIKQLFSFITTYVSRMCSDFYLFDNPSSFATTTYFNFKPSFKGYNPKLHRTRTPWAYYQQEKEITEFLTCKCGHTTWAFSDKTVKYRPEITLKRARYRYPKRF